MLEAKWASPMSKGKQRWTKIRNVIIGVAQFRRAIRRRSISLYSNSGSEFDQISHASVDSYLDDHGDKSSVEAAGVVSPCKLVFSPETNGVTAATHGVNCMTTVGEEEGVDSGAVTSGSSVLDDRMSTGFLSRLCFFSLSLPGFCVWWGL